MGDSGRDGCTSEEGVLDPYEPQVVWLPESVQGLLPTQRLQVPTPVHQDVLGPLDRWVGSSPTYSRDYRMVGWDGTGVGVLPPVSRTGVQPPRGESPQCPLFLSHRTLS